MKTFKQLLENKKEIVSVREVKPGIWMVTVDGTILGDARPQPTRQAAVEYAKKLSANWHDIEYRL
jgi:hypothetical protein